VDIVPRLADFLEGFSRVADRLEMPLVVSVHPRTEARIAQAGINPRSPRVRLVKPLGFFDFVALEKAARIVLSDSGTVQEECAILHIPSVTLRDVTERPETIECGSSVLSGAEPDNIEAAARLALGGAADWLAPPEYLEPHVARTVANIVLGHQIVSRG
jgi:UDP-N-acetylglucosamine 2-epimerase (non-hydrolysing)